MSSKLSNEEKNKLEVVFLPGRALGDRGKKAFKFQEETRLVRRNRHRAAEESLPTAS